MNAINNSGIKTMIPARHLKVSTADLMGRQMHKTLNAELFDSALKKSLFEKSMRDGFGENSTDQNAAFYFSDAVAPLIFDGVQSSPRISVVFNDAYNVGFGATGVNVQSAKVEIDIEFNGMRHGRGPVKIELELPDRLLGLENVFKKQGEINSVASKYNGLLFNNTPAELNSNLYDVFNFVGAAFARGLELDRSQSLNLDTPSPIESISSALDETVGKIKRPEPQELSCAEFAKAISVEKLVNHGWGWKVSYGGKGLGFADGATREEAISEVHKRSVNNAIYFNSPDGAILNTSAVFPPEHVMAEYPDLKVKFAEVFAEREMKQSGITVHNFVGTSPGEVYDQTQIDDSIKDGDVLNLGQGNVAILMKAWPTVVVGEIEHFHRLASGVTIESVDDGKYAASAAKAREVSNYKIKEEPVVPEFAPSFEAGQRFDLSVGDSIVANGYRGSVGKVLDGQLEGMVEVRLPGGVACVSASFPECFPAYNNGVEVVTEGNYSGPVKEVSGQFVVQSLGRGRLVAHECHRFDGLPAVGDSIDLKHSGGKVSFVAEKDKGRGNER